MNSRYIIERRALQLLALIGGCVPVIAGGSGMILGAAMLGESVDISLDSHFRYLSGLLFGIGLGFWSCIPHMEEKTGRVRILTALVVIGGVARLSAAMAVGMPSLPMILAIGMELVITPLLCIWQARIAGQYEGNSL